MLSTDSSFYGLMVPLTLVTVLLTHQGLKKDLEDMRWQHTIYSRTVKDTYGKPVHLRVFQGQVLLIMPESDGQEILDHLRKEGANIGHIFSKIKVKGKEADPLYKMLTLQQPEIEWNFVKFLVDRKGRVYQRYGPKQEPSALVDDIELLLKEN